MNMLNLTTQALYGGSLIICTFISHDKSEPGIISRGKPGMLNYITIKGNGEFIIRVQYFHGGSSQTLVESYDIYR